MIVLNGGGRWTILEFVIIRCLFEPSEYTYPCPGVALPICTNMTHVLFHYCKLPADRYKPNCPNEGWDEQLWDRQFKGHRELSELQRWLLIVLNVFRSCYLNRWFCKFRYISVSTIDLLGPGQLIHSFHWDCFTNKSLTCKCEDNCAKLLRDGQRCVVPCTLSENPYSVFHKPRARSFHFWLWTS